MLILANCFKRLSKLLRALGGAGGQSECEPSRVALATMISRQPVETRCQLSDARCSLAAHLVLPLHPAHRLPLVLSFCLRFIPS